MPIRTERQKAYSAIERIMATEYTYYQSNELLLIAKSLAETCQFLLKETQELKEKLCPYSKTGQCLHKGGDLKGNWACLYCKECTCGKEVDYIQGHKGFTRKD